MSDDDKNRVLGVLDRLNEALEPYATAFGLNVVDDCDGCRCCAGVVIRSANYAGVIRMYFSSRASEGRDTRLKSGWTASVDIDENDIIRNRVSAPTKKMTSAYALLGFFLEQLPLQLAQL